MHRLLTAGLVLIVAAAPAQFGFEVLPDTYLSPVDPLVWLVFGLWVFETLKSRALRSVHWPPLEVFLLVALAAVSGLRASNRLAAAKNVFQWCEYFIAGYLLFAHGLKNARLRSLLVWLFAGVAGTIVLAGAAQYFGWLPALRELDVRGTFLNRNVYGGYLALALPFLFGLLLYDPVPWRRAVCLLLVGLGLISVLSGGALLGIVLAALVLSALHSRSALLACIAVVFLFLTLLTPRLPRENDWVLRDSIALFEADGSVTKRCAEWQAAAVMAAENPWLGVGTGNYQMHVNEYYWAVPKPPGVPEPDTQNLYLVLAGSLGVLGPLFFVALLVHFARCAARAWAASRSPLARGAGAGVLGSLLAYAVCSIWSPLLVRGIGLPLVFLCALAASLSRETVAAEAPALRNT